MRPSQRGRYAMFYTSPHESTIPQYKCPHCYLNFFTTKVLLLFHIYGDHIYGNPK